jgi:hypothetical protein
VQRRDRAELLDRRLDLGVDEHRLDEAAAAVDDAVARCRDALGSVGEGPNRPALVTVDEVQLEAGRPGVDDEDAHAA